MKKFSLLYIHNGNFDKLTANKIQVLNMSKSLNKYFDFRLLAFGKNKNFEFKTYLLNIGLNYYLRSILLFIKSFFYKCDIYYSRDLIFSFLKSFFSKKVIYEIHEVKLNILWRYLLRFSCNRLLSIVTISQGLKKDLIKLGISSSNILVAPDGVNLNDFDISKSKSQLRKDLILPSNKKLVLYMGSFQNWKGYDTLLNASKFFDSSIQLVMVGGSSSQISHLKKLYPETIFRSFVNNVEVPNYLHASDILVLPNSGKYKISSHYTSPLKLFEYMACKKPIIASNLPSIKEIVSSKEVIFFKADSSEDLFKKITKVLKDKDLIKLLSKNSFEKVKKYTWEKRALSIHDYIKNET